MSIKMNLSKRILFLVCCVGFLFFAITGAIASNNFVVKTEEADETIQHSTNTILSGDMREGLSELRQEGKNGRKKVVYSVSYRHDKEVSRKKESETVIEPATDEIIVKGTKKYYLCSNGIEYDNVDDKNECEKRTGWEKQRQTALQECRADSSKFNCWYDEYPGTTLHWSYRTYNESPSANPYRSGAICRDGWHSSATGRGACSHHGGVLRWL